jgi:hypothetical protein
MLRINAMKYKFYAYSDDNSLSRFNPHFVLVIPFLIIGHQLIGNVRVLSSNKVKRI